jgi:hypothetical protein
MLYESGEGGFGDYPENHPLHNALDGSPLDDHFDIEDLDTASLLKAEQDVNDFFHALDRHSLLDAAESYADREHIAHDFWLTRNGHGAGFWDGDYEDYVGEPNSVGDRITDIAKGFGECHIIVCDNGKLDLCEG